MHLLHSAFVIYRAHLKIHRNGKIKHTIGFYSISFMRMSLYSDNAIHIEIMT